MKWTLLLVPALISACGGSSEPQQPATTTTVAVTTTAPPATTTTTVAPTTTHDREEEIQVAAITQMFPAERRVEICLMQLKMLNGGLPASMIIDLGVESFAEGFGTLKPKAEQLLRQILGECLK